MKYRTLGSTNLKVSVIGVGTWQFGGEWGRDYTPDEATAIMDAALEVGINLLDTAECYGDHLSEQLVGQAIEKNRDKWIVATKFGHHFHAHLDRTNCYEPDDVRKQLEASLKSLRTDYVDLYQFHSGTNEDFDTDGLWETLTRFKEEGKVRHLGISIGANDNIHQTSKAGDVGAETIQVVYNRLAREPEAEVLPSCEKQNLGVLARVPLASGFLSGKYDLTASFPANDVRHNWEENEYRRKQLEEVQRIVAAGEVPADIPMAQWALAWCLKHDAVTCVIPGCKTPEQVKDNAAAADLEMVSDAHPQSAS